MRLPSADAAHGSYKAARRSTDGFRYLLSLDAKQCSVNPYLYSGQKYLLT
jgi:hypothetical protein